MTKAAKFSGKLTVKQLRTLKAYARRTGVEPQVMLDAAIDEIGRREEARKRVLEYLGPAAKLTDAAYEKIRDEWRG